MPRGVKAQIPPQEWENPRFLLSLAELAEELGVCQRTIRRFVQRGMPRRKDGRMYLLSVLNWYFWNVQIPSSFNKEPQPSPPQVHSYLEPIVDGDHLREMSREMERGLETLLGCRNCGKSLL